MKPNKFVSLLVVGLVLSVAATGCKKKPTPVTTIPGARTGAVTDAGRGGVITPGEGTSGVQGVDTTGGIASNPAGSHEGWLENATALKSDTVYFDFDSAVVKSSEQSKVAAVADYLKANPSEAVRVEGNCDERGTEEYNRALGDRRAQAVREELVRQGIDASRVDTISYGKDKPAVEGHDESAWKKNRRDDFVVLSPPNK